MSNDANTLKKRQEIKKYLVYAGMFLLFIGCMWWIFAPSKEDRQEETKKAGFNTELPDPRGAGIEGDKIAAYEQADMRRRQEEKMRTLEDFSSLADEKRQENPQAVAVEIVPDSEYKGGGTSYRGGGNRGNAFASSASAYNDINATLGSFYQEPEEDPEKEALKAEVEQMKQAAAVQQPAQMTYEEQVTLLEKSYEFAAKYTPGGGGANTGKQAGNEAVTRNGKAKAVPVGLVSTPVVSSLPQPVSDSVLFARLSQPGRFHTAIGNTEAGSMRNTVRACIHGDQTVISGQGVRMRLLEPMRVGKHVLPKNTLLTGESRIQGERLNIGWNMTVSSFRWNSPCMTTTDRTESSFPGLWKRARSRRWRPTWDRTSARASPSPTSPRGTNCYRNSARGRFKGCRNMSPKNCGRKRYISNQAIL